MDDAETLANQLDGFIQSVPEVQKFKSSNDDAKLRRIDVHQGIRRELGKRLERPEDQKEEWLLQLAELDLANEHENDIDTIASLLSNYVVDYPWIYDPSTLNQLVHRHDSINTLRFTTTRHGSSIVDYQYQGPGLLTKKAGATRGEVSKTLVTPETVAKRANDQEAQRTNRQIGWAKEHIERLQNRVPELQAKNQQFNDLLRRNAALEHEIMGLREQLAAVRIANAAESGGSEHVSSMAETIEHSDYVLGVAGFFPGGHNQSASTQSGDEERKEDFLSQFRDHVTISDNGMRKCATVNFLADTKEETRANKHPQEYIDQALENVRSQIGILEEAGRIDKIPYLLLNQGWLADNKYAKMAEINVDTIRVLFDEYQRIKDRLWEDLPSSGLDQMRPRDLASLVELVATGIAPGSVTRAISQLVQHQWFPTHSQQVRHHLIKILTALNELFNGIGMDISVREELVLSPFDQIISMIALAVQFLGLVLQSYLRASMTPFHFDFLACSVSDFVLHGATTLPDPPRIHTSSQKLSCLGDMLQQEVLVFGLREPFEQRIDIVATPSQLVDMWGPAELIVKKANPSNGSGPLSIVGIRIWGGIILPTGESVQGIQMWHWLPQCHIGIDELVANANTEINLYTPIRVGATCLIELNPIGPALLNMGCPHTSDYTTQFDKIFSSSLKVIGTKDSTIATQSIQVGLQAGQFVNIVANGTFIRKPGRTAKEQILNSAGLFEVRLADFDRIWGLFISPCTGVMSRARLRELVAFFCLRCSPKRIPPSPSAAHEKSMHEFARAMCDESSLNDWFESLIPDDKRDDFSFRERLQNRIISLFNDVLDMIKDTGILENGDLAVAWLSPGNALDTLTLSARKHPWIRVLSDSSLTATFACISPHCFQTMDCACQIGEWRLPSEFRLSTKLDIFAPYLRPETPGKYELRIQKSYPINSSTLNILAYINGVIMLADADPCYYITIKKSVLPLDLLRYTRHLPVLRENNSPTSVKVVISGGSKYIQHLEELQQQGKLRPYMD